MKNVKTFALCLFVLALTAIAHAQVTGLYAFGPFDNSGFDQINRGNLNVHFSIPIFSKPGRGGTNFVYALNYDGLIWTPTGSSGNQTWVPVPSWGWTDVTNAEWGYVTYKRAQDSCTVNKITEFYWVYSNYVYHDSKGNTHPIPFGFSTACGSAGLPTGTGTYTLTDNSGLTVYRNANSFTVFSKNGAQSSVPAYLTFTGWTDQSALGAASYTDTNGNVISASASGVFTDTMGVKVLSVSGAAPNPVVYTYTDSNGNSQTVTVNYTSYTIQTAFGASGISEYSQSSVPLVSSIVYTGDGSQYTFSYEMTPGNSSAVTGRIAGITLRTGGTITYAYSGGSNGIESDGTTAGLKRTTSDGATTYARSGINSTASTTTTTDALGNASTSSFLISSGTYPGYFYEIDRAIYSGAVSGTPLAEVTTCYNVASSCSSSNVNEGFATVATTTNQNGIQVSSETQSYTGPELLSVDSISGLTTTTYSYSAYTGPESITFYRLASAISSVSGTSYQETTYGYDETTPSTFSGSPQPATVTTERGNLTSVHQWTANSSNSAISVTNAYDTTGTVQSSTGPTGTTTIGHDSTGTFPTSVTPPTSSSGVTLTSSATYDSNTGLLLSTTDPNGTLIDYSYTGMMDPLQVATYDSSSNMVGKTSYNHESINQIGVQGYQSASTNADTEPLLDGYGRLSRVAVANGQGSNPWYQQDTCYDADGRVSFQSYPYQGNGWATAKVCSGSGDTYSYDALGRLTQIAHADGTSVNYTYIGRAIQVADENGVTRITQIDGLGRITTACEVSSSTLQSVAPVSCGTDIERSGFVTAYTYNLPNHTTTVSQGAQTRTFQTDWVGRPTSITEPERGATTYTYAYNATGLLLTRTRPQANQTSASVLTTTTTQYDSLGRPNEISYNDNLTPTKLFYFDTSAGWTSTQSNIKGRLSEIVAGVPPNASGTIYSYDATGRPTQIYTCLPSGCGQPNSQKALAATFDWTGNLIAESDPVSGSISYGRSLAGEVTSITNNTYQGAGNPANLISNITNGPDGPITYTFGNGRYGYDSYNALGQQNGAWVCSTPSTQACAAAPYGYYFTGHGSQVSVGYDNVTGQGTNYTYDEFNRLTSTSFSTGQTFNYVYDRYGNRWQQNAPQGGNSFSVSYNAANNQLVGYSYDAAGNMTNDGAHSYTYDAEGNILQVDGGATAQYTYDVLNRRVRTEVGSSALEYLYDYASRMTSSWLPSSSTGNEGRIYWDGRQIAFRASNGQTYFDHKDWVGTERMRTDYTAATAAIYYSLPWGDGYSANVTEASGDSDAAHFADLEQDENTASAPMSEHAQFRQYSPAQGRWMSPDPYSGSYDFTNPQSMNRYSYVLNNPLSFRDPSGLVLCDWGSSDNGGEDYDDDPDCAADGGTEVTNNQTVNVNGNGTGDYISLLEDGGVSTLIQYIPGSAPSKGISVTKAQAACAADVLINYGLGFIPGYNGLKLAATLAGANFNFVQNLTAGKSIVTFDNGGTIKDPLQGILWGANGLASTYSAISTAAANGLDASDVIVKAAGTAGTVANLLNTASAAYGLYQCKDAN